MKRMSAQEFKDLGLLHEVNRRILHPLGLALEVIGDGNGNITGFGKVQDNRHDSVGMRFKELDEESIKSVKEMEEKVIETRIEALGYWIQH